MRKVVTVIMLVVISAIYGCHSERKTCRELFDEYYDVNMKRCITAMVGVDSLGAAKICACMFDKLFELDSTFVYLKPRDMEDFVNKNVSNISVCDSL